MMTPRLAYSQDDPTLTMGPVPPASDVRVLVAICHNVGVVDRQACRSLIEIGWGNRLQRVKDAHGIAAVDMAWYTKMPRVDALRNLALEQAMADGFTHVVFLDADMIFPTDLLDRLLAHVRTGAVVSGLYFQRHHPFAPIAYRDSVPHESGRYREYRHDDEYTAVESDGLRDEELVGMGCCLIPLLIVQTLGPRPWFEYRDDCHGWPMVSEDVPFCEKVRAAGFRVALDPTIKCGHVFGDIATEAHWERYLAVHAATQARLQESMRVELVPAAGGR